ncbi:MAG: CHASE2 domain-containing protein [Imperialibacter sp.]|uniref:CHASE2 domain-containing protein n=1 Tax=Imperialibacter sp. TaxID=2038411 RepID=UPI0032EBE6C4
MKANRREFWLDSIFGTAFIFLLMWTFYSVTAFKIFDLFDPIGDALGDVELTDVVFSQLREPAIPDDRIVLVNLGRVNRADIGYMIDIVNQYEPKVIGLDTYFRTHKDSAIDATMESAFSRVDNLVIGSILQNFNEEKMEFDSLGKSLPRFTQYAETGFVNFITDAQTQEELKMTREFTPKEMVAGQQELAFAVKLAQYLEPEKVDRLLKRGNERETINYRGNVMDFGASVYGTMFFALDVNQVFDQNFDPSLIKDKIVIFCFLGEYLGDRLTIEDKYYSPINSQFAGRSYPDMFGGVVHANIVAMILNEDYIDAMDDTTGAIIGVLLCLINVAAFSYIYRVYSKWYDGATKLIQLIEVLGISFMNVWVLDKFNYKPELTIGMVAIALAGDSLEVYYSVVKNSVTGLFKSRKRKIKL